MIQIRYVTQLRPRSRIRYGNAAYYTTGRVGRTWHGQSSSYTVYEYEVGERIVMRDTAGLPDTIWTDVDGNVLDPLEKFEIDEDA